MDIPGPSAEGAAKVLSTLAEEGMRTPLDGVGAQSTVETELLARLPEEGEQDDGQGDDQAETVAAVGAPNVDVSRTEPEAPILLVAEVLLDGEAPAVELDDLLSEPVPGGDRYQASFMAARLIKTTAPTS